MVSGRFEGGSGTPFRPWSPDGRQGWVTPMEQWSAKYLHIIRLKSYSIKKSAPCGRETTYRISFARVSETKKCHIGNNKRATSVTKKRAVLVARSAFIDTKNARTVADKQKHACRYKKTRLPITKKTLCARQKTYRFPFRAYQ